MAERAEAPALKTFVGPKFIASVVASLCTEDAAMITGQDIHVGGGAVLY
jgi:NAD(P)-dependent dehydrogenase (short-subunit alcohol dehydrogenase family)